jgi:PAS domain S-box-containing protein
MKSDRIHNDKTPLNYLKAPTSGYFHDLLNTALFSEMMDCVDDFIIVLDSGLHIVSANRASLVFFGYSELELSAKHLSILVEEEERRQMTTLVRGLKERRGAKAIFLTRSYRKVPLHFSLSPLLDENETTQGFLFTGRSANEDNLFYTAEISNHHVKRMLEGFADPLFIVDGPSRTVVDCNPSALAVLGFTRDEFIGWRLLSHAASEEEREQNRVLMARAEKAYAKAGIFKERLLFPRKNGPALPCDFIGLPFFKSDGSVAFIVAMLFDCSSEDKREAELASLLSRANSLASDFAAAMSHSTHSEARCLSTLGFTSRQIEIARLVALGASSKDIGFRIGIAESTVRNHLSVMFHKLGVTSRMSFMHILTEQCIRIA